MLSSVLSHSPIWLNNVLYFSVFYSTTLNCTGMYSNVFFYFIALYFTILYFIALYFTVVYSTATDLPFILTGGGLRKHWLPPFLGAGRTFSLNCIVLQQLQEFNATSTA